MGRKGKGSLGALGLVGLGWILHTYYNFDLVGNVNKGVGISWLEIF